MSNWYQPSAAPLLIALLECRHRARARVEDQIRADKDTRLRNLPFRDFKLNAVWLELILIAHDLIAWTHALALTGEPPQPLQRGATVTHTTAPDENPLPRGLLHDPG